MRELLSTRRMWRRRGALRRAYDVVIIGGGAHGLATAYYLARRGITDVAVLERRYIGSGAAGRNTAIVRANYATPASVRLYRASVALYRRLATELRFNLLFSQRGHLTLAHTDSSLAVMAERARVNRMQGVDSRLIGPDEVRRLCPPLRASHAAHPIVGALYHPPGGIIRHDAVVWGFARGADAAGVEIHADTEVLGLARTGRPDRRRAHESRHDRCRTGTQLRRRLEHADLRHGGDRAADHQRTRFPACVTEAVKPLLGVVVVSSQLHVYISQSDRGELVIGSEIEPWTSYRMQGSFAGVQELARRTLELFPQLERARLLRSWAGLCDVTPDYSPILGATKLENFHLSAGWGTYGFKAAPIVGRTLAELVDTGGTPNLIAPFALERFYEDRLVSERTAVAVSH